MDVGDHLELAGYEFVFEGTRSLQGPNYVADEGEFSVYRDGERVATMFPQKRRYQHSGQVMTEAAIDAGITRDLYISLGESLDESGSAWAIRIYHKPFIRFIWIGALFMMAGGLLAAWDRRYRRPLPASAGAKAFRRRHGKGATGVITRLVPILILLLLGVLLAVGLTNSDHKEDIPSPLIGKPMPQFKLPLLGQNDVQVTQADLIGEPFLLNVWASWCATCRIEHPVIESLAASGALRVIGLNYRDDEKDASRWLDRFGNPYAMNLADPSGRTAIDFGVYAAPESFLVDASGKIVFKQIGAMSQEVIDKEILPRLPARDTVRGSR